MSGICQVASVEEFFSHGHVPVREAIGVAKGQCTRQEASQVVHLGIESLEFYLDRI